MKETILDIQSLTVRVPGGNTLIQNVNLSLREEECVGIVGESGSGKTMTAKAALQLLPAGLEQNAQKLELLGQDLLKLPIRERRALLGTHVGFVPQNTVAYLHPLIKIKKQMTDGYLTYHSAPKIEVMERAEGLLEQVGIRDLGRVMDCYPGELSGGMRQRVNIAMALMCDPKFIIADEPTTALDCVVQRQVTELFHSINVRRHVAIIMISHDLNLIRHYCQRIVVMYAGQVVEAGESSEVFAAPEHPYTRALLSIVPRIDQNPSVRLTEIPGYVSEQRRDVERCLFLNRCAHCSDVCNGPVSNTERNGHFVRCTRAWEAH